MEGGGGCSPWGGSWRCSGWPQPAPPSSCRSARRTRGSDRSQTDPEVSTAASGPPTCGSSRSGGGAEPTSRGLRGLRGPTPPSTDDSEEPTGPVLRHRRVGRFRTAEWRRAVERNQREARGGAVTMETSTMDQSRLTPLFTSANNKEPKQSL